MTHGESKVIRGCETTYDSSSAMVCMVLLIWCYWLSVRFGFCGPGEECRHGLLSNGLVSRNGCHQLGKMLANARWCLGMGEWILVAVESSTFFSQKIILLVLIQLADLVIELRMYI